MRKPFSIKRIERRSFEQKYKFSNKNDMEECSKKNCGKSTYDKWTFKPQFSSIFYFDRVSDSRMAHVLGVKEKVYEVKNLTFTIVKIKCTVIWDSIWTS